MTIVLATCFLILKTNIVKYHPYSPLCPPPPPRGPPPYPRSVRPPDYSIAAQMAARSRQMVMGRAHSVDGTSFYDDVTDPDDDDDDAQVSAV
ncbi:hypothetical protein JTE90_019799 [Oedothorax gibbosus]|uniref:Uncharacterized protein n=1 Tax=Oedothorax gibbosus TaxID=931172 RepID=A0AAV6V7M1_9ARAC|nr:hypothetical protein JTE90_019799 [Oedothorax gibbosus]